MANSFAANTLSTTRCTIEEHRICNDQQQDPGIEPNAAKFLILDSLIRKAGVTLTSFTPQDILTATNNARCALGEGREFPELSDDAFNGYALVLLNALNS